MGCGCTYWLLVSAEYDALHRPIRLTFLPSFSISACMQISLSIPGHEHHGTHFTIWSGCLPRAHTQANSTVLNTVASVLPAERPCKLVVNVVVMGPVGKGAVEGSPVLIKGACLSAIPGGDCNKKRFTNKMIIRKSKANVRYASTPIQAQHPFEHPCEA